MWGSGGIENDNFEGLGVMGIYIKGNLIFIVIIEKGSFMIF